MHLSLGGGQSGGAFNVCLFVFFLIIIINPKIKI